MSYLQLFFIALGLLCLFILLLAVCLAVVAKRSDEDLEQALAHQERTARETLWPEGAVSTAKLSPLTLEEAVDMKLAGTRFIEVREP